MPPKWRTLLVAVVHCTEVGCLEKTLESAIHYSPSCGLSPGRTSPSPVSWHLAGVSACVKWSHHGHSGALVLWCTAMRTTRVLHQGTRECPCRFPTNRKKTDQLCQNLKHFLLTDLINKRHKKGNLVKKLSHLKSYPFASFTA